MLNWLRRLMVGRYGGDQLNNALLILCIALVAVNWLTRWRIFMLIGVLVLLLCYFRMFSRNIQARYAENQQFLKVWGPVSGWVRNRSARFHDRKFHRYLKCPSCKTTLRVPRGKGKINVTCPKCKRQFTTKS